jgi:hypothetical protein
MSENTEPRGAFKIWLLHRIDGETVGVTTEFLITAKTEQAARELACDTVKPEDSCVWLDRRKSRITELGRADQRYRSTEVITSF